MRLLPLGISLLFAGLGLATLTGCTDESENDKPIIDSLDVPTVVTEQNGQYAIPVAILFHDNDREAITHVRYRLPPTIDAVIDIQKPNPSREGATVVLNLAAATCGAKAERELDITVVDARGAESAPQPRTIVLK